VAGTQWVEDASVEIIVDAHPVILPSDVQRAVEIHWQNRPAEVFGGGGGWGVWF
jgi:hypothetical protein